MRDVGLSYESLKRHALLGFAEARHSVVAQIRRIDATQDWSSHARTRRWRASHDRL
jgi:hypothetical protein